MRVLKLFKEFSASGSISGLFLLDSVIVALVVANFPLGTSYEHFLALPTGFNGAGLNLNYPLRNWINDGLMAMFFLMVGLEIKRFADRRGIGLVQQSGSAHSGRAGLILSASASWEVSALPC